MERPQLFKMLDEFEKSHRTMKEGDFPRRIFDLVPEMNVFMFRTDQIVRPLSAEMQFTDCSKKPDISLPFPVCAFGVVESDGCLYNEVLPNKTAVTKIGALFVREVSPEQVKIYCVGRLGNAWSISERIEGGTDWNVSHLIAKLLKFMRQGICGTERINKTLKIKANGQKRDVTIRNIIHVRPSRELTQGDRGIRAMIDWTHRWEVQGHWRRISGLGKDRAGAYTVSGYTWVNPHTRGPEDKPVIKKTRMVDRPEGEKDGTDGTDIHGVPDDAQGAGVHEAADGMRAGQASEGGQGIREGADREEDPDRGRADGSTPGAVDGVGP